MSLLTFVKSRTPIVYIILVGFIIVCADMFFPGIPGVTNATMHLTGWASIIQAFAFIPVTLTLIIRNVDTIKSRKINWYSDAWALVVMLITFLVYAITGSSGSTGYQWLFSTIYTSAQSAVWGIIGLYMMIVPIRAFTLRNTESAAFTIACLLIALKNAPIGGAIWSGFPLIGSWIVDWPFKGVSQVLYILTGIGTIMMALRIIRGKERGILA